MKKIGWLLLIAVFALSGCEKDDICDPTTSTTPRLIIEFYNAANPTVLRNVVNLKVIAVGQTDTLDNFNAKSKIELPLKTTEDVTKYNFIYNSLDSVNTNEDFFEINYSRENVYVSRACGFKTVFTLNDTDPIVVTDDAALPDGNWIQNVTVQTNLIENENITHVKIYF